MTMHSIIYNGATIYFDEPIDFHLIRGKLMIDSVPYKPKTITRKKTTKTIKSKNTILQMLTDAGLKVGKPVTINLGDYSKKSVYQAVKRLGFQRGSIEETGKTGVYKISCI